MSDPNNPLTLRQWLQHAYEETLDQAVYLRRAIDEIENDEMRDGERKTTAITTDPL